MSKLLYNIGNFLNAFRSYRTFKKLNKNRPNIVFFSEMLSDHMHFRGIIDKLLSEHNQQLIYLASSEKDKLLEEYHPNLKSFYIGEGLIRTIIFKTINTKLFIMTMPDLETFYLKRSLLPVHYVYIFHSLVSTFMIYRHKAFDAYNTIFTAGRYHEEEIRYTEAKYNLRKKQLVPHGYSRLDQIYHDLNEKKNQIKVIENQILIAPTWGKNSISNVCVVPLITILLNAGVKVVYRPHPMTIKYEAGTLDKLKEKFINNTNFSFDTATPDTTLFLESNMMISDWSGVAFEFAYGLERPVLFIDVPKKINNEKFLDYDLIPVEERLRSEIGEIVKLDELEKIPEIIKRLLLDQGLVRQKIIQARTKYIYNLGKSDEVAANKLLSLLESVN